MKLFEKAQCLFGIFFICGFNFRFVVIKFQHTLVLKIVSIAVFILLSDLRFYVENHILLLASFTNVFGILCIFGHSHLL